MQVIATTAKSK